MTRPHTWRLVQALPGAACIALTAALTAALAGCTSSPSPATSTSALPMGTPAPTVSLAVYYTISEPGGPKLVREFHSLSVADESPSAKVGSAVSDMLGRPAIDPDYITLWPGGVRLLSAKVEGDTTTVDLSGVADGLGGVAEGIALQQLVYTVTAASGQPKVRILKDGQPADSLFGHVSTKNPLTRGKALDVLYGVWIISPQQGEQPGRDVQIHLAGIAFEATINYDILRDGKVVKHQVVTLDAGAPQQGEFTTTVQLDPGDYVIQAYAVSQKDGGRQHQDSHTFTVV
jgi:sporulation and spore germination protein/immunoglobulin-like protein involved in spore germination